MVKADDADSDVFGEVEYSISSNDKLVIHLFSVTQLLWKTFAPTQQDFSNRFEVNTTTGRVYTKAGLDREQRSNYTVTITATDSDPVEASRKSQTVEVTIIGRHHERSSHFINWWYYSDGHQ